MMARIDRGGRRIKKNPYPPLTPLVSHEVGLREAGLPPDCELLSFERMGQRRSLLALDMAYHHVAQGELGGEPYLISFCARCSSGVGLSPVVRSAVHHFAVVGGVHGIAILQDDETRSLWDAITGECFEGELAGERMAFWPIEMTTVGAELAAGKETILIRSADGSARASSSRSAWEGDGWATGFGPREGPSGKGPAGARVRKESCDPRLPLDTLGLGVMDANHQARFYPLAVLAETVVDTWQGRPLQVMRGDEGVPCARYLDDGERPMQTLVRWYGFSFTYPRCEVYGDLAARETPKTKGLLGRLRHYFTGSEERRKQVR